MWTISLPVTLLILITFFNSATARFHQKRSLSCTSENTALLPSSQAASGVSDRTQGTVVNTITVTLTQTQLANAPAETFPAFTNSPKISIPGQASNPSTRLPVVTTSSSSPSLPPASGDLTTFPPFTDSPVISVPSETATLISTTTAVTRDLLKSTNAAISITTSGAIVPAVTTFPPFTEAPVVSVPGVTQQPVSPTVEPTASSPSSPIATDPATSLPTPPSTIIPEAPSYSEAPTIVIVVPGGRGQEGQQGGPGNEGRHGHGGKQAGKGKGQGNQNGQGDPANSQVSPGASTKPEDCKNNKVKRRGRMGRVRVRQASY